MTSLRSEHDSTASPDGEAASAAPWHTFQRHGARLMAYDLSMEAEMKRVVLYGGDDETIWLTMICDDDGMIWSVEEGPASMGYPASPRPGENLHVVQRMIGTYGTNRLEAEALPDSYVCDVEKPTPIRRSPAVTRARVAKSTRRSGQPSPSEAQPASPPPASTSDTTQRRAIRLTRAQRNRPSDGA